MSRRPLSGRQLHLVQGRQHCVVTDVGAAVRAYSVDDRDVFVPFGEDEVAPAFHGMVLAPWPNRLRDGRYEYAGRALQVPITEVDRSTALHGLTCWQRWVVRDASATSVQLDLDLPPSPGYPFELGLSVRYALDADGLAVEAEAVNRGATPAPYGIGFHPWLSPGPAAVDDCELTLDAATRVTTDERLLPVGVEPAAGAYDLRSGRPLRGVELDDAYVDVIRDAAGLSWARLRAPDGRTAAIWMDGTADVWQVCTGDAITPAACRRTGVAAEPMTCVADAFRTGERLIHLEPDARHVVRWGARLL